MHTNDVPAAELRKAGLNGIADKATSGYYHDFLSPLDTPSLQISHDLIIFANAPSLSEPRRLEVQALLARHLNGDFDASKEEGEAWAARATSTLRRYFGHQTRWYLRLNTAPALVLYRGSALIDTPHI